MRLADPFILRERKQVLGDIENMSTRIKIIRTLAGFVAIGTAAGLSMGQTPKQSEAANCHDTWLRISAFTDIPLAGADVDVYNTAGRLLFQRQWATNDQGVYPARVKDLPRDFRVTVSWDEDRDGLGGSAELPSGRVRRLLGGFKLSADVRNFDPVHGVVYVNPATAIVSRVMDRFPNLSLEQAQALVRRLLGLPPNASLGAALREGKYFRSSYFSASVFLEQASQRGGVEAFIEELVREWLAGHKKTYSFVGAPTSSLGGVLSFVATNLAKGAISWAAGQGCGWVAQSAGLISPGATAEDIANLQAGLADLQSSVDQLSKQMQALTNQVLAKLDKTQYNTIVVPALALASQVNGVESDLTYYAQGCPALPETGTASANSVSADFCSSQKVTISAELNDVTINHSYETLSTYVLDNPTVQFNGMIHLFSQSLGESVRFFRPADSTKVQNMFDYWDSVQTQAANLKVELLHLNGAQDNPGGIAQLTSFLGNVNANPPTQGTFQNTRDAEQKLMFPAVPVGTVIDTKTRFMWRTDIPTDRNGCFAKWPYSASSYPYTDNTYMPQNGLWGWTSPFFADFQTLVDGGGSDPMGWLIAQTKAVAPDTPQSAGFPDIVYAGAHYAENPGYWCINSTAVWSVDPAPPINGSKANYLFDFKNGTKISAPSSVGYWDWLFLRRPLERDEQYYWYP